MKILHTSDWHLGHTLYNYDRTEEQMAMLQQMVEIVKEQRPDVFLICGDVYHTPQPTAAVQTMFANALVEIHDANPGMAIIVIAGNHDSSTKHEIFRTPWKALKVFMVGSVDADKKEDMIIEVPGKGYVIAVPYVSGRNMPKGLFQELLDSVGEKNTDHLPVVMSAHTTVRGCDFSGHDNASEYSVGGIDSCDLDEMGTGYDYLALGHIHHAQFVHSGKRNVSYCGTPIPVSFDENYNHSVTIVEIAGQGEKPSFQKIGIEPLRPLVTLPAEGVATWEAARELLENYPDDIEAYIRLNVQVDDFLPVEANAEAHMICEGKRCRFCIINSRRLKKNRREAKVMSVQEFKTEEPIGIAERYAADLGIEFDNDMKALFNETLAALKDEERL